MPTRLRVLSDLHVGSVWGLWPPGVRDDDGRDYPQNPAQQYLWQAWAWLRDSAPQPDYVVLNGDLYDGPAWRLPGEAVSSSLDLQQRALVEVLRNVVRPGRWWAVAGTPYHEPERVGVVAELLGARRGPAGQLVHDQLYLRLEGLLLEVSHHPDGGPALYRAGLMEREGIWALFRAAQRQAHRPDVIVHSHNHQYLCLQQPGLTIVSTPGWQLQTRYALRRRAKAWLPTIGAVDLLLEEGEQPVVQPHLFDNPLPRIEEVSASAEQTGRVKRRR